MPCEMLSFCNLNLHSSQKAQWRCGAYGTHVGDLLCGLKRSLVVNKIVILLLLFKTVIAGDSWGQIAVPLIQETTVRERAA